MENQHRQISGYRELSQAEIDLINKAKALGNQVGELIGEIGSLNGVDQRALAVERVVVGAVRAATGSQQSGGCQGQRSQFHLHGVPPPLLKHGW